MIPDHVRTNFQTLVRAAKADDLAVVECRDAFTGEVRYVICAMGGVISPFGHLSAGNPYEDYLPPT